MEKIVNETTVRHGSHEYRLLTRALRAGREVRELALRDDVERDDRFARSLEGLAKIRNQRSKLASFHAELGRFFAERERLTEDLSALLGKDRAEAVLAEAWRRVTVSESGTSAPVETFLHALGLFDELPVALTLKRLARLETRGIIPMVMAHRSAQARVTRDVGSGTLLVMKENWETSVLWQTGRRLPVGFFVIENDEKASPTPTTTDTHPLDQFFYWDHRWRELGLPRSAPMIWITPPAGLTPEKLEPCARFRFSFTVPQAFEEKLPSADPATKAVREVTVRASGRERKFLSHRAPSGRVITNCVRNTADALALDKMRRKTEALWAKAFVDSGEPVDATRPWLGLQTDAMLRGRLMLGFLTLVLDEALSEVLRRIEREGTAEASSLREAIGLATKENLSESDEQLSEAALTAVYELLAPKENTGKREKESVAQDKVHAEKPTEQSTECQTTSPVEKPAERVVHDSATEIPTKPVEQLATGENAETLESDASKDEKTGSCAKPAEGDLFGGELLLFPEPPAAHPTTREWRRKVRPKNATLQGVLFTFDE